MDVLTLQRMAREELAKNGLHDWCFELDNCRTTFGSCNFYKKKITMSRILSKHNTIEECRDTLLHEIAHALAGDMAGHGEEWKHIALRLGCRPKATFDNNDVVMIEPRWIVYCESCDENLAKRHRRTKNIICPHCRSLLVFYENPNFGEVQLSARF